MSWQRTWAQALTTAENVAIEVTCVFLSLVFSLLFATFAVAVVLTLVTIGVPLVLLLWLTRTVVDVRTIVGGWRV